MIRIRRPAQAPSILAAGRAAVERHVAQRVASEPLVFDRTIYAHEAVKQTLRECQHDKCCFCESRVSHVAFGDVEHFRPKAAYRAAPNGPLIQPAYFWLAYEWTNLMFACEPCNRRHKASHFPLLAEADRASTPDHDLSREQPIFIDPSAEDPSLHIGFREEYPFAVGESQRGESTWRALGLDREPLAERRRDLLRKLRTMVSAFELLKRQRGRKAASTRAELLALLRSALDDAAEYAAVARASISVPADGRSQPRSSAVSRRTGRRQRSRGSSSTAAPRPRRRFVTATRE